MLEGLGMDKIMGFYISPDLMFPLHLYLLCISIYAFMHFHLCISISPKILKDIFADGDDLMMELIVEQPPLHRVCY